MKISKIKNALISSWLTLYSLWKKTTKSTEKKYFANFYWRRRKLLSCILQSANQPTFVFLGHLFGTNSVKNILKHYSSKSIVTGRKTTYREVGSIVQRNCSNKSIFVSLYAGMGN